MTDFSEKLKFDPEQLSQIFNICKQGRNTCLNLHQTLHGINSIEIWQGSASVAARESVHRTRLDIHGHADEVEKIGKAAGDCYEEGVILHRKAKEIEHLSHSKGWSIEGNSLHADHLEEKNRKEFEELQEEINSLIADASRFDEDLAALFNATDGWIPLTPPGDSAITNGADRRANEYAAFVSRFHHPPRSEGDWNIAEIIDPHSYDPKNKGVKPIIQMARIDKFKGGGSVRAGFFIPSKHAWNFPYDALGDHRGFDPNAPAEENRVAACADFEHGYVFFRQNPSSQTDGQAKVGTPKVEALQGKDGTVYLKYKAMDPFIPGGQAGQVGANEAGNSVHGQIAIKPNTSGPPTIGGTMSDYPDVEIYHDGQNGTQQIYKYVPEHNGSTGPIQGLSFTHTAGDSDLAKNMPFDADRPKPLHSGGAFGNPSPPKEDLSPTKLVDPRDLHHYSDDPPRVKQVDKWVMPN